MIVLQFIPVALSLLVLGAHYLRSGPLFMVGLILLLFALFAVRRPFAARTLQAALLLGTLVWIRTAVSLASARMDAGEPWARMAVILGVVAAVNLASLFIFKTARMKAWYRIGEEIVNEAGQPQADPSGTEGG